MSRNRSWRRFQAARVIKKRKRLMRDTRLEHQKEDQLNRYNKQHPYDCGNPQCGVCHFSKVAGLPTVSDLREAARLLDE